MKKNVLILPVLFACSSWIYAADNKAEVHTITEERKAQLIDKEHAFPGFGLQIKLKISGPDVPAVRKYGNVKITKAMDDADTDLTKSKDEGMISMSNDSLQEINWAFDADEKDHTYFNYEVRLAGIPARKATTIKLIEGTIDLVTGGEEKVIEIKDLAKQYGKPLTDESLKKSGIEMTLMEPGKGMFESNGVTAKIKGDSSAIKVEVLDANGESISNGSMWSDEGDVRTVTYMTNDKPPAGTKLKITCFPGQKKISVPIKLENIALP